MIAVKRTRDVSLRSAWVKSPPIRNSLPFGDGRTDNAPRLAHAPQKGRSEAEIATFLTADAVLAAKANQETPGARGFQVSDKGGERQTKHDGRAGAGSDRTGSHIGALTNESKGENAMKFYFKSAMLTAALSLSACASMGETHRYGANQGPTATQEARAHDMQCPMMGMMTPLVGCHGGARGDPDARLASLHTALAITPSQEAAWNIYAEAYRANAGRMSGMMSMMQGGRHSAPSQVPEQLRHHETMMSQHLASLQALRVAIATLYAALSDEQKAAADALHCER